MQDKPVQHGQPVQPTQSLAAVHALLRDWLHREASNIAGKPNPGKMLAVELLYVISIAKEYLRRLPWNDAVARLKNEHVFLQFIYTVFTTETPTTKTVNDYFSAIHEQVVSALMDGRDIDIKKLEKIMDAASEAASKK
jgi:hypothetical protein